jgi:glucokinase
MKFAIGIDLGGTRIKGTAVDADGNILHRLYTPTYDGNDAVWKHAVADTVNDLMGKINGNSSVIGISAPGLPSDDNTTIAYMPGRMQGLEIFHGVSFYKHLLMC